MKSPSCVRIFFSFLRLLSALPLAGVTAWLAAAEPAKQTYNLPAGEAASTLRLLSETARREILFSAESVRGVRTQAVQGERFARGAITAGWSAVGSGRVC